MTDDAASAPAAGEVRSALSDGQWHRLHPLTPLLRGGLFLVVVLGIVLANLRERIVDWFFPVLLPDLPEGEAPPDPITIAIDRGLLVPGLLAVAGVLVVLLVAFTLSWRMHTFRITGDDVEVRSGILFRTHRRAPLDRVQGVNLTRPLLARLLGLAKLEVVGAGTDANVKLDYLATPLAEAIRGDILRLASGRRLAEATGTASPGGSRVERARAAVGAGISGLVEGADQDSLVPESLVSIPPGRLVASKVLSGALLPVLVFTVIVVVGAVQGVPWLLFAFVPAVLGAAAYLVNSTVKALRYSIAPVPDGIRLTFGLFTTVTEIVPPRRVHGVEVRQPILWRPFGWWSIAVTRMSGRASADSGRDAFTTVVPVGTRDDVEAVLRLLLPDLPASEWPSVIDHGMRGPVTDDPYTTIPRRARLLRPWSWRRDGILLTSDALFLRRGVLWRRLGILPLARMQSVGMSQGPIARAFRVAGLTAHVVTGPVSTGIRALDRDVVVRAQADVAAALVGDSA